MEPQQTNPTPEILPTESSKMRTKKYFYIIICLLIFAVVYIFSNLYVANNREPAFVPHFDEKTNCYWQDVDLRTCGVSDTYNWKTYKNEEYGFEFKYPSDYEITSDLSIKDLGVRVYLNGVKDKGADFFIDAGYQKDVNPSAWFISSAQYDSDVENFDLMSTSTLNINYDKNMVYTKNYLLRNSDKHYSFAYSIHSPVIKDFDKYIKDIKKIISTFKLIK